MSEKNKGYILAKKGKETKRFAVEAWNKLGSNKLGWVPIEEQTVVNSMTKPQPPPPFEETKASQSTKVENKVQKDSDATKVSNDVEKLKTDAPVDNKAGAPAAPAADVKTGEAADVDAELQKKIAAFNDATRQVTKPQIKDYLDKNGKEYDPTSDKPALVAVLGDLLQYDVEKLKTDFV